jgi:short-subunit dehydrogenase
MKIRLKPLREQVMVITGASSGIGLATARLAASRGARLVLAARSERALRQLAAEIHSNSGHAVPVVADVTAESDVYRIADEALGAFGRFDTWVNNAGVSAYGACLDVSLEDMRRIMETNFWGVVYGSRIACRHLRREGGALINLGSVVSDRAVPLQGIYSASKHAIKGWTDALRAELLHEKAPVSVTLVKPGAINTPYAEHAKNYLPDQPSHTPPVYSPESVADAIVYAAENPIGEIAVGGAARLLSLASVMTPSLLDRIMARVLLPATHSGRPRHGHPALYEPSEDLRVRGDYPGLVRGSLYTRLITHRGFAGLLGAGAGALLALNLERRKQA